MAYVSKIEGYDVKDKEARDAITQMYRVDDTTTQSRTLTAGQVLSEDWAYSTPAGYEPMCVVNAVTSSGYVNVMCSIKNSSAVTLTYHNTYTNQAVITATFTILFKKILT